MKKKIIGGIAILALAAVAAFNVNFSAKSNTLSDVSLTNINALAGETSTSWNCSGTPTDADCSISCGKCGTKVDGTGSLTGSHSCSN